MEISVIIPTRNRCDSLSRTLESIVGCGDPIESEIVIVDNGSTDSTAAAVRQIASRFAGRHIRYVYEPVPGLLAGRHRGIFEAHGDICAFLDDDVRVGQTWYEGVADGFSDPAVGIVGGPSRPLFCANPPDWLDYYYTDWDSGRGCTWLSLFDGGQQTKDVDPIFVWGLNFAIRRRTLFDLGGFHPDSLPSHLQRFQGDGETGLSLKAKKRGVRAIYHPLAEVLHEVPAARMTREYFARRAFYQGICDSYTAIRDSRSVSQPDTPWRDRLRRVKRACLDVVRHGPLRRHTGVGDAYRAGYRFHQREVADDPVLLSWVLQPNYWDYVLPDLPAGRLTRNRA